MQYSTVVGQNEVGMAFNIEAETEEEFIDFKALLQNLYSHDVLSRASYYWVRTSMSYENVTVSHNPDLSTATTVKITAAYGKIYIHFYFSISVYCFSQCVTLLLLSQYVTLLLLSQYVTLLLLSQYLSLLLLSLSQFTATPSISQFTANLSVSQFTAAIKISVCCYCRYLSLHSLSVYLFIITLSILIHCYSHYTSSFLQQGKLIPGY